MSTYKEYQCASIVQRIHEYKDRHWQVRFTHTYRDFLANHAHSLPVGLHVLVIPPRGCGSLLLEDNAGTSFPRLAVLS